MADEAAIIQAMASAYKANKTILLPVGWTADRQRTRYLRIPLACDCDNPEITGVSIEGTAWSDQPDERVGFQLKIDILGYEYRIARIDWKPRQPHLNKVGPPALRGRSVMTSIHDFPENVKLGVLEMQTKNLPVAESIDPEPIDFPALLQVVRDRFRLVNALEIPTPPWSPQLF